MSLYSSWSILQLVSSNKEQTRATCKQIEKLAKYFKIILKANTPFTPELQDTVDALAEYVISPLLHAKLKLRGAVISRSSIKRSRISSLNARAASDDT